MRTLTIRLPDDTCERLKQLASSRGISLDRLTEELSTAALAASADKEKAIGTLARLDAVERHAKAVQF